MEKEKAIELIKKVLAKAGNNPSEHEVEVATLKAQELMIKYGLSMSEVDTEDKKKPEAIEDKLNKDGKMNWYMSNLASVIAKNFRCDYFIRNSYKAKYMVFVGLKEDIEIANETYAYVRENIEYFADYYVKILHCEDLTADEYTERDYTACRNSYISGFINGIDAKFKEQVDKNNWGLMIVKPEAVIEYMDKLNLKAGRKTHHKSEGYEHYSNGYKEGKNLEYRKDLLKNKA